VSLRVGPLVEPGSLVWRVNGEGVLLLGGGRALILQVAHPKVAAGVAQHSNFRAEPWKRLLRTLDVSLTIGFGSPQESRAAALALRRTHARVTGTDDRGEPYSALDPELLLWVQATLIETALLFYERYVRELRPAELARYYEQMRRLGEPYGLAREHMPADVAAFRRYFARAVETELRVTDTTRDVADAVLNPDLPLAAWPVRELTRLVTVGTLPEGLRAELGLEWGPGRERLLSGSQAAIRHLLPMLPAQFRRLPRMGGTLRHAA
jgi:uncharacterized protein (DUF2236 family)